MNKKNLFLISGIIIGIAFIISLLESEPGTLLGSFWLFRLMLLIGSASSFMSYFNVKKSEK